VSCSVMAAFAVISCPSVSSGRGLSFVAFPSSGFAFKVARKRRSSSLKPSHSVAFRVSDEEAKLLNDLVALSGLTKQDYITRRLLCRDVVVQGNPRVYKALKNQMAAIHEELKRMERISPDNDELLYTLQVIAITLDGLKGEDE